ncbi:hypothetical protein [Neotabrizicola sp. VNH66]|uniref:hypothetical protein n=1 Tax=Neotabrizicola sp. VNH66 TaxID=3400918 RepID=UPI003C0F2580
MSRILIVGLLISNAATGYGFYQYKQAYAQVTSNMTTNQERASYGARCVEWIEEWIAEKSDEDAGLFLGRSWRKHGQLVFEVYSDPKLKPETSVELLCVADAQSGMMFSYSGEDRSRWMFFE